MSFSNIVDTVDMGKKPLRNIILGLVGSKKWLIFESFIQIFVMPTLAFFSMYRY